MSFQMVICEGWGFILVWLSMSFTGSIVMQGEVTVLVMRGDEMKLHCDELRNRLSSILYDCFSGFNGLWGLCGDYVIIPTIKPHTMLVFLK